MAAKIYSPSSRYARDKIVTELSTRVHVLSFVHFMLSVIEVSALESLSCVSPPAVCGRAKAVAGARQLFRVCRVSERSGLSAQTRRPQVPNGDLKRFGLS
jgi:hypothetical protein